jgi:hypothetical protein
MLEVHQRKGAMPVHPFSETSVITPTLNYITQGKQVVQDVSIKPMQVEKTARKTVQSKDTSVLGSKHLLLVRVLLVWTSLLMGLTRATPPSLSLLIRGPTLLLRLFLPHQ